MYGLLLGQADRHHRRCISRRRLLHLQLHLLLHGLQGKHHCLLLVHAFQHERELVYRARFLGLLCHVREVTELVLGVMPLLLCQDLVTADGLLLLLLHRRKRSSVVVLVVTEEPCSAPRILFEVAEQVPQRRVHAVCGVSEEVWRQKGTTLGNLLSPLPALPWHQHHGNPLMAKEPATGEVDVVPSCTPDTGPEPRRRR
jgi:hypothetical protein